LDALPDDAPQAGDRFPWLKLKRHDNGPTEDLFQALDDLRFHLFVFGLDAPAPDMADGGDLEIHVIPDDPQNDTELSRAKIPRPSFYLVRPDGYIGLCGTRFDADAVVRYLVARR
jgi:hypothetical protein